METTLNKYQLIGLLKKYYKQYERYIPTLFFVMGFSFDLITIGEIDDFFNILLQAIYLIILGKIIFTDFFPMIQGDNKYINYFIEYKSDIFHFLLGSLLSAFTIFYFKSSSVANSFLFLCFLVSILLLNEFTLFKNIGIIIRSSLYMLCLLSYLIYVIPIMAGKTGFIYFILSTIIAIILMLLKMLYLKSKNLEINLILRKLIFPQASIILIFVLFYIFKLIPPVPLSLKYIGVFHNVEKVNDSYRVASNKKWYNFWSNGDQNFEARYKDKVYIFTKVFSPAGVDGKVYIHWLKETSEGLKTSDRIPLNITGGRKEGFRGYAFKENYTEGQWQVRIETNNGIEIGRINFTIENDKSEEERKFKIEDMI